MAMAVPVTEREGCPPTVDVVVAACGIPRVVPAVRDKTVVVVATVGAGPGATVLPSDRSLMILVVIVRVDVVVESGADGVMRAVVSSTRLLESNIKYGQAGRLGGSVNSCMQLDKTRQTNLQLFFFPLTFVGLVNSSSPTSAVATVLIRRVSLGDDRAPPTCPPTT